MFFNTKILLAYGCWYIIFMTELKAKKNKKILSMLHLIQYENGRFQIGLAAYAWNVKTRYLEVSFQI